MPDQSSLQAEYIVTARKWRPQRFADVVGQEHVTRTLRNAVGSKRIHHAYIFNGPRGVGKTTTARILAKAVNCENPSPDFEPCNVCASCTEINTGRSMDVIEIDGASNNSVDDIRKLRENAKYPPIKGAYKMYIIDEVHMLSTSAFNALLKTLEEPPRHLLFVFATTEPHKVPATILSRCQRFDFRRMQIDEIAAQLSHIATQEGIVIDDESLAVIGKKGDGSMRDSQSIFDQVIAFCGKNVEYARVNEALNLIDTEFYFTLGRAIREHDVATILDFAREVFMRGYDLQECLHGLAEHFRNILTILATQSANLIEASKLHREQYTAEATHFTQADVLQYMTTIMNTEQQLRFATQPRLRFEFALIQMAKMDSAIHISDLLAELAELKKKVHLLKDDVLKDEGGSIRDEGKKAVKLTTVAQTLLSVPHDAVAKNDNKPSIEAASENEQPPQTAPSPTTAPISSQPAPTLAEELVIPIPPPAKRTITAAELTGAWRNIVDTSEKLDGAVKTYLQTMASVVCNDGEMVVSSEMDFVADKLSEKRQHLTDILQAALGADISITIVGGTHNKASAVFDSFTGDAPAAKNGGLFGEDVPEPAPPPAPKELHELDRAIIELFGAKEVPVR
jgi:DNA polymerase-3 subunit gamma/tau